ncbi:hypothetical protein Cgig2_020597 [Carnegiea gigantea]|uniref:Uncharacterized protein n=1 Tax=Carnegiea gigantea TaxID=171969 RepID=A0A9Q1JYA9_9CARY|nr:hypothetical protein Cgig2_020597 [Carnegiea gigantea]
MANNLLPAATTLFLLLLTLATADTDGDLVLDIEGNPLEVGSEYYIFRAGGILGAIGRSGRHGTDDTCPLYVIQYPTPVHKGDLVKFVPVNETQKEIHLSSDVKIDSGESAYCGSDGFWRPILDAHTRSQLVIASASPSDTRTTFRIQKIEGYLNAYKIVYPFPRGQGYLSLFHDLFSGLTFVRVAMDSTEASPFIFSKNKKDVVASMLSFYGSDAR